jgi:hypothetical protein
MIFGNPGRKIVDNAIGKPSDGYGMDRVYAPVPTEART